MVEIWDYPGRKTSEIRDGPAATVHLQVGGGNPALASLVENKRLAFGSGRWNRGASKSGRGRPRSYGVGRHRFPPPRVKGRRTTDNLGLPSSHSHPAVE